MRSKLIVACVCMNCNFKEGNGNPLKTEPFFYFLFFLFFLFFQDLVIFSFFLFFIFLFKHIKIKNWTLWVIIFIIEQVQ